MSVSSERVVVPFAAFTEYRDRRSRVATAVRDRERSAVAGNSAAGPDVPIMVAPGDAANPPSRTSGCDADESVTSMDVALRAKKTARAPVL